MSIRMLPCSRPSPDSDRFQSLKVSLWRKRQEQSLHPEHSRWQCRAKTAEQQHIDPDSSPRESCAFGLPSLPS